MVILSLFLRYADCQAAGTPTTDLFFALSDPTAFIKDSRGNAAEATGTVDFSLKWDGAAGTLTSIQAQILYNPTLLRLDAVHKNASWAGNLNITEDVLIGGLQRVQLEWTGGTSSAPTSYTVFGHVDFTPLCQAESNSNAVDFTQAVGNNEAYINSFPWTPASGNYDDGTVTTEDEISVTTVASASVANIVGSSVTVAVTATTNVDLFLFDHRLIYDSDKLNYVSASAVDDWITFFAATDFGDSVKFTSANIWDLMILDDDLIYTVTFDLLCDPTDINFSTAITFTDSSYHLADACDQVIEGSVFNNGSIDQVDSVRIEVDYTSSNTPRGLQDQGDPLNFDIKLKSTYQAGDHDDVDNNISICFQADLPLANPGHFYHHSQLDFGHSSAEDSTLVFQKFDPLKDNYIYTPDSTTTLFTLRYTFDPTNPAYTPIWSERFVTPSLFIDGFSLGSTIIPDSSGCILADSITNNGLLEFTPFTETLFEIIMGEIDVASTSSFGPCGFAPVYVRSLFDLGSFSVEVFVGNGLCITGISGKITGVQSTRVDDQRYRIYTDANFVTVSNSTTQTYVARVHIGIDGNCYKNFTAGIGVDQAQMWDDLGAEQLAATSSGGVSLKCGFNGSGCNSCGVGGPCLDCDPITKQTGLDGVLPKEFALHQNYPNPFNPVTKIILDLPTAESWRIVIFNINGQIVDEFSGSSEAGTVTIEWDGSRYASGVYFYTASAGQFTATRKMVMLK